MNDNSSEVSLMTENNVFIQPDVRHYKDTQPAQLHYLGEVSGGLHRGKEVSLTAVGDEAKILDKILPGFKEFSVPITSCAFDDNSVKIQLRVSNRITILTTDDRAIQQHISSVRHAAYLQKKKGIGLFRKLEESLDQFALLGRITSVKIPHFYPGCPKAECWQKKCEEDYKGRFHCPTCNETTTTPLLSVVVKVIIKHGESQIEVAIFNNDAAGLFRMDLTEMEQLIMKNSEQGIEEMKQNLPRRDLVFLIRPHVWEKWNGDDAPQWQLAHLVDW